MGNFRSGEPKKGYEEQFLEENQMADQIKELVHIGVNADLQYFVNVQDETLEDAAGFVESDSNFENLEDDISVESFTSVIDKVKSVVLYGEDKTDPEIFYELETGEKRIFGIKLKSILSTSFFVIVGGASGYLSGAGYTPLSLSLSLGLPALVLLFGFMLIKGYVKVPSILVKYPEEFKRTKGDYTFEITGSGLVQMFFDDTTDSDGKNKAKYILGLEKNPIDEVIYLSHFVSLNELKGIYLSDAKTEERLSENLLSPLRRVLIHSSFKYELIGYGVGFAIVPLVFLAFSLFD